MEKVAEKAVKKEGRFKKTEDFNWLLRRVDQFNAREFFERYPFRELRDKCLESLGKKDYFIDKDGAWAEEVILDLLQQSDYAFAHKVLEWYVFANKDVETEIRAIEFALNLEKKIEHLISFDRISKLVAGKLLKTSFDLSHGKIPSLRAFLVKSLLKLKKKPVIESEYYHESDWYCAERALKIIVEMETTDLLREIEMYLRLYETGKIKPGNSFPEYERAHHISIFRWAKRNLLKAKKENKK